VQWWWCCADQYQIIFESNRGRLLLLRLRTVLPIESLLLRDGPETSKLGFTLANRGAFKLNEGFSFSLPNYLN
jgi:hypothetical protein